MGIKGLTGLIQDEAPNAIKPHDIKTYFGRKVAIDASMSLYQFLIAVRQQDGQQLMSESGETTSHLMGFFYRTLRMIDHGIKPMYVFDGKPPDLKKAVLANRFGKREEAREEEEEEKDVADNERMDQLARRQVRPTKTHNDEVRQLLGLMGIPCITVYGAGSEDMDTLTFGSPILLKHLTFSEQKKMPVHEVNLEAARQGLGMNMDQFIDLCILLGCDYLDPIKGIGPKTALKLIRDHGDLDEVVEHLKTEGKKSIVIPDEWPYQEARKLFKSPDVQKGDDLELHWKAPDVEGLVKFLCQDKGFSEDRVRKGAEKLTKALSQKQQGRLDGFFKVMPAASSSSSEGQGSKGKTQQSAKKTMGGRGAVLVARKTTAPMVSSSSDRKAKSSTSMKARKR
ncbi:Elongation of fatty acids protein 2 [Tilletia horrida]|nr:Elongation of fatty acids protein 2 [Tilletia horrida]